MSGGLDSTVTLAYAISRGYNVDALSFRYGQRHSVELDKAKKIADFYKVNHRIFDIMDIFMNSALLASSGAGELNVDRTFEEMSSQGIPSSFVPGRNIVLLAIAASHADAIGAKFIFYGAHADDHIGYPDCRPEFYEAMSLATFHGTKNEVKIYAPFGKVTKDKIIEFAQGLISAGIPVPLYLTHSCYQGLVPACGVCDTCKIRIKAFQDIDSVDPIEYAIDINW